MSDTPETVVAKLQGLHAMIRAFEHYIGAWHDGDWKDCQVEGCYQGDLDDEPTG